MERRDRSLKALEEFKYIDSLEADDFKAKQLKKWVEKYITDTSIEEFDLTLEELKSFEELFFKNLNFIKSHQSSIKDELDENKKIKKFLH